jgi:hypothetical protein
MKIKKQKKLIGRKNIVLVVSLTVEDVSVESFDIAVGENMHCQFAI